LIAELFFLMPKLYKFCYYSSLTNSAKPFKVYFKRRTYYLKVIFDIIFLNQKVIPKKCLA